MDLLRAILLGIIEGITEFLPISSTGHLIIAQPLLGVDPEKPVWRSFLFLSQSAAVLAVVVFFARDLWRRMVTAPLREARVGGPRPGSLNFWSRHLLTKLLVAFIPAACLGLLLNDVMEKYLENPPAVALALIVGAGLMELVERFFRRERAQTLDDVTLRQAFFIGMVQVVSMWPGTSRAMVTIMGGMMAGLTPRVATEFSFYLAIPTLGAAGLYRLWKYRDDLTSDGALLLLVGCATAFLVALLAVAGLMEYVKRYRFTPFAIYRVVLGLAVLGYWWSR